MTDRMEHNHRTAKIATAAAVALAIAAAGCGGNSTPQTAQHQVRAVETQYVQDFIAGNMGAACKLADNPAECQTTYLALKAAGYDLPALVPADWRNRVAKARITVTGNTATMAKWDIDPDDKFVRVNGHWELSW